MGAGRKPGPEESVRRNRVVVMLTDGELGVLTRLANRDQLPLGTALYMVCKRALRPRR